MVMREAISDGHEENQFFHDHQNWFSLWPSELVFIVTIRTGFPHDHQNWFPLCPSELGSLMTIRTSSLHAHQNWVLFMVIKTGSPS
jgi:hypothetical protein